MELELRERVAIVTGGAKGIGLATAQLFAQAGAAVAIWDFAAEAGQAAVAAIEAVGGRASFTQVNVAERASVDVAAAAVLERWERIDILVNNAGITRDAQLVKARSGEVVGTMAAADWDAVIAVNQSGVFNCTQAVVPTMIARRYGRIISAASVVGLYGNFGQTNYVATKAAVIGMTRVWARELGKHGITANAVAPGFIATEMTQAMPEPVLRSMVDHTPVGRMGLPADVAQAYLFLASDAASFVNGAVLSVDGGLVIGT